MSETYTKLYSSITDSSIWAEDDKTRLVWVTMLAMADRYGFVGASVSGLAARARVSLEATRGALAKFLAPDPDSRSREFDGRRIELADRGWTLLNHARYRDMRDEEIRKEYERTRKQIQRDRQKRVRDLSGTLSPDVPMSAQAEADTDPNAHSDHADAAPLKTGQETRARVREPEPPAAAAPAPVQDQPKAPEPSQAIPDRVRRAFSNLAEALAVPLAERCQRVSEAGQYEGRWASPDRWPELIAVEAELAKAEGRAPRGLKAYDRDAGTRALVELFVPSSTGVAVTLDEALATARRIVTEPLWSRGRQGLSSFTAEVVRRSIAGATALPVAEVPRERAPDAARRTAESGARNDRVAAAIRAVERKAAKGAA